MRPFIAVADNGSTWAALGTAAKELEEVYNALENDVEKQNDLFVPALTTFLKTLVDTAMARRQSFLKGERSSVEG